jgi:hypothetical protein
MTTKFKNKYQQFGRQLENLLSSLNIGSEFAFFANVYVVMRIKSSFAFRLKRPTWYYVYSSNDVGS